MELKDIKARLPLSEVLRHYGLKPDKSQRLHCPFHNDRTPSMQVYYKTGTVYCFSANCPTHGHSLDVIDFVMHKEGCSKGEAIIKCKAMAGNPVPSASILPAAPSPTRAAFLQQIFTYFKNAVCNSQPARAYLESRGLDYRRIEVGYNTGQFHHGTRRDETLISRCLEYGLLLDRNLTNSRTGGKAYQPFAKFCIVFALRNRSGEITGLYFRSTVNNGQSKHFYLKHREGLYPGYPDVQTRRLILTESVIDAASLLQQEAISKAYGIIALYGTNGLTGEIREAIKGLTALEEIVLLLDNDAAGRAATEQVYKVLQGLHPQIRFSVVSLPCKDVNETLIAHEPQILEHLLATRSEFFPSTEEGSTENKTPGHNAAGTTEKPSGPSIGKQKSVLDTSRPHKPVWRTETAVYTILGGVDGVLSRLQVTIEIARDSCKRRFKADLYDNRQLLRLAGDAAAQLSLPAEAVEQDLHGLSDALTAWRETRPAAGQAEAGTTQSRYVLTTGERTAATEFLKRPKLLQRLGALLGETGITGEEQSRLFLLLIAISHKTPEPLHALIQGSSGSGKTRLLQQVSDCMPQEDVLRFTRVTESSLYNYPEHFLTNRLLCFEDMDGLKEEAQLAVRELISNGLLTSSTSTKDEAGQIRSRIRTVRGPVASLAATTRGSLYEDNMGRVFVVAVDERHAQTERIIEYQNRRAAGLVSREAERAAQKRLQDIVRCLEAREVVNPYAQQISLPREAHKIRRLNDLFQSFIRMVTLVHQYQRKTDERGRLTATAGDIRMATEILFDRIVLKVDELDGSLRGFFEQLKAHVQKTGGSREHEFCLRELRQALGVSKTQLFRYIGDLVSLEYVRQSGGHANRGFVYRVVYWDDYEALRARIRGDLEGQLDKLEHHRNTTGTPEAA